MDQTRRVGFIGLGNMGTPMAANLKRAEPIGYPDAKAIARQVEGNLGIIHFDRHIDTARTTMDERMHTTHWSHATDLPNVPATNLVQIGIGGGSATTPASRSPRSAIRPSSR